MKQQIDWVHAVPSKDSQRLNHLPYSSKSKLSAPTSQMNEQDTIRRFSIGDQLDTGAADYAELCQFREKLRDFRKEKALLVNQISSLRDELSAAAARIFELEEMNQRLSKDIEIARKNGGEAANVKTQGKKAEFISGENEAILLRKQIHKLEAARKEDIKLRHENMMLKTEIREQREHFEAEFRSLRLRLTPQRNQSGSLLKPNLEDLGIKNMSLEERLQDVLNNDGEYRHQFAGSSNHRRDSVPMMDNRMYVMQSGNDEYTMNTSSP